MNNDFDIERARSETPACNEIVHFNNAGASLMPIPVCEALHDYLRSEEHMGGYEAAHQYNDMLEKFYAASARLLNCSSDEIAYVESATRGWDLAFYSFKFKPGDKILTSIAEYGSNIIAYLQQAKKFNIDIIFIPNDEYGQLDTQALVNLIDDRVKLISITHIPTSSGLVNPAKEVGKIAKSADIPFLLDSCQGVGQIPLDVEAIGCDILSGTGRKYLRGPRGTGLLYIRKKLLEKLEPPFLDQHSAQLKSPTKYEIRPDAKRFESWEQYCAGKFALTKAIEYSLAWGLDAIQNRIYKLAMIMRQKLLNLDAITITDDGIEKCGIVTFTVSHIPAETMQKNLALHKINVCISKSSGSLVSFLNKGLTSVVRASVHYYNTEEEIDYFIDVLQKLCCK